MYPKRRLRGWCTTEICRRTDVRQEKRREKEEVESDMEDAEETSLIEL